MPEEQDRFREAAAAMLDAVLFESWLRFYFLDGEDAPRLAVPERAMARIRESCGALAGIAEALDGREATLRSSREAVCGYIARELEGTLVPRGSAASILDSRAFAVPMQLFGIWVQASEDLLDGQFLDFDQWRASFRAWRSSERGLELAARMEEDMKARGAAGTGR